MSNDQEKAGDQYPWWVSLPIFLAPILLFLPAILPGRSLFWGITSLQFVPWHWEALKSIQSGELPLWNTLNGLGAPLAANYQSALFYPPTWLTLLAGWLGGLQWMAWAHGLLIVLHLIWAGWGMKKLTAYLGISTIPQVICGLSYGMCGYLVARGSFLTMVQAASWIPWILLTASHFAAPIRKQPDEIQQNSASSIFWLTLAFSGQWLSGHAQLSWYTLLFCLSWLITGALINGGYKRLLQIVIPVALSGILGFLLCSIQLIPTIEYFIQSQRSGVIDYQTALSYSFWPWRMITLIFPDIFGNPGMGDYWGYASYWEDAIYIGLLPFFFALYSVFKQWRRKPDADSTRSKSLIWFCSISIVVISILGLGWNTPIFPWLFYYVPTFGAFNGPTRWMIVVEVSLILLAGLGAEEWIKHNVVQRKQVNLALTAALAMILSAAGAWIFLPDVKFSFKFAVISSGVLLVGYLLLTKIKPKDSSSANFRWRYLFILWLMIDLLWAGGKLNPAVASSLYLTEKTQMGEPAGQDSGRYYMAGIDERDQRFKRFFIFEDIRPIDDWRNVVSSYLPNINILSSMAMLNNFDPMVPDRYTDFITELEAARPEILERYLALANVDHIAKVVPSNITKLDWKVTQAYPRAHMVSCAEVVPDGEIALAWLKSAAANDRLKNVIVVETKILTPTPCRESTSTMVGLPDLSPLTNKQEYQIIGNPSDSWLFIADTWYPGWKVKLDGKPVGLYRADYLFMGVQVPKGDHRIELYFESMSFLAGLNFSLMALMGIILLGVRVKNSKGGSH